MNSMKEMNLNELMNVTGGGIVPKKPCPVVPFDPFHPERGPVFQDEDCEAVCYGGLPVVEPCFPLPIPPITNPIHPDMMKMPEIRKGITG